MPDCHSLLIAACAANNHDRIRDILDEYGFIISLRGEWASYLAALKTAHIPTIKLFVNRIDNITRVYPCPQYYTRMCATNQFNAVAFFAKRYPHTEFITCGAHHTTDIRMFKLILKYAIAKSIQWGEVQFNAYRVMNDDLIKLANAHEHATVNAVRGAAAGGHLDVVKQLCTQYTYDYTVYNMIMNTAISAGHLHVVQHLLCIRPSMFERLDLMTYTCSTPHVHILRHMLDLLNMARPLDIAVSYMYRSDAADMINLALSYAPPTGPDIKAGFHRGVRPDIFIDLLLKYHTNFSHRELINITDAYKGPSTFEFVHMLETIGIIDDHVFRHSSPEVMLYMYNTYGRRILYSCGVHQVHALLDLGYDLSNVYQFDGEVKRLRQNYNLRIAAVADATPLHAVLLPIVMGYVGFS
jgi:hypothetical protein